MRFKQINNNGFTLIEIIASIAILGMVIAVLLPIFPQIMSWNNNTDDHLIASNLLDQAANDIKSNSKEIITGISDDAQICPDMSQPYNLRKDYHYQDKYYPVVSLCKEKDLALYRTFLQIYSKQEPEKVLSETYIYLIGEANE